MTHVVTATHPITLEDGRPVGPGEKVARLKTSDPHNADLIESGLLTELPKKAAKKPQTKADSPAKEES